MHHFSIVNAGTMGPSKFGFAFEFSFIFNVTKVCTFLKQCLHDLQLAQFVGICCESTTKLSQLKIVQTCFKYKCALEFICFLKFLRKKSCEILDVDMKIHRRIRIHKHFEPFVSVWRSGSFNDFVLFSAFPESSMETRFAASGTQSCYHCRTKSANQR